MSNSLDTDQDHNSVRPDLGPKCMQRLSAEDSARNELTLKAPPIICMQQTAISNFAAFSKITN